MSWSGKILWIAAAAFTAVILLGVPLIGVLHAAAGPVFGMVIIGALILVQWPVFVVLRRYLPKTVEK